MTIAVQIFLAWLWSHFYEYIAHRYVLHGKNNFKEAFKHHFSTHHSSSRKNDMYDSDYDSLTSLNFEIIALFFSLLAHIPIAIFFPYAYITLAVCTVTYYLIHRKSHIDTEWGKKWLPWHYDHHMGKNQHVNWGVRLPIFDYLFSSRVKYFKFRS